MKWDTQTQSYLDMLAMRRLDESNHLRGVFNLPPRREDSFSQEEVYAVIHFFQGGAPLRQSEEIQLMNALKKTNGNKTEAAKILGVSRSTVFEMIKRHKNWNR